MKSITDLHDLNPFSEYFTSVRIENGKNYRVIK